jgi:DNA-directed RNA polymerase specialized sigma24 family protein
VASHDEQLLRRFVACRDAGDGDGALRCWGELVERNFDRVRAMVDLWGRGGRLSQQEREEATQRALVKLWRRMVHTFEGATMGEWVNATKSLVDFACRDVQRAAAVRSRREASLDKQRMGDEGDVTGAYDSRLAELAHEQHRRAGERGEAADFIAWALPRIGDERRRLVLERTLDGVPAEEVAVELGVSMANLYQLRSRGLKDVARLWEEWDG